MSNYVFNNASLKNEVSISKKMFDNYLFALKVLERKTFSVNYSFLTTNSNFNFDFHKNLNAMQMAEIVKIINKVINTFSNISILNRINPMFQEKHKFFEIKDFYQGFNFQNDMEIFSIPAGKFKIVCFFEESISDEVMVLAIDWQNLLFK